MMKISELRVQPSDLRAGSSKPLLIGPKDAPPQWIEALENWCRNAPENERVNRLEAAKHVLQQYANPHNRTLDLSTMALTSLPPGLWHLANLQELNVSQNLGLRDLPDDLDKCATLHSIDASSCVIQKWPACLSKLPSLKTLLLDDNPGLCVLPEQIRQCRALEHLSMEATKPRHFIYPPNRHFPPGEARGRTLVRSAPSSPRTPHGNSRTRSASPPAHAASLSIASLLGFNKAHQLDKKFGSLQWPHAHPGFRAIKSWESNAAGRPLMLSNRIVVPDEKGHFPNLTALLDLEKLKTGKKKYMWAIGKRGRLIIAEEKKISINTPTGKQLQYMGHPTLVGGGRARIAGELLWFQTDPKDPSSGKFYINNYSGRFSLFADRNEAQLQRVAELFEQAGLTVETAYTSVPQPQRIRVYGLRASDRDDEVILPEKTKRHRRPDAGIDNGTGKVNHEERGKFAWLKNDWWRMLTDWWQLFFPAQHR